MSHGFEEKETVRGFDLDQYHRARRDGVQKDDNVDSANHIENHVPWTGQGRSELVEHL